MRTIAIWLLSLSLMTTLVSTANAAEQPQAIPLNHIVAVANDDVILRSQLDKYLRGVIQRLRQQNTPIPAMNVLEKRGLERLVLRSLQVQRAKKTGIQVSDDSLNSSILAIARKNNMRLEEFRQALVNEGIDYNKFREDIRNEIIIGRLRKRDVTNRISITEREIKDYLSRLKKQTAKNKQVKFSHILIGLPDAASPAQIQAARKKAGKVIKLLKEGADFSQTAVSYSDGQKAMQGGHYDYRPVNQVPPLFAKTLVKLQPGEISPITRSPYGFHIIKLDAIKGESRKMILQTRIRHILISTSALISDKDARLRLNQIRDRLQNGEDFATLARAHSTDTVSAKEGGNLGWIGPGETVPQFEQAYANLTVGNISKPFKTKYGWHIAEILERRQYDNTEKLQRNIAINNLRKQKNSEALQAWLRRLRDEAYIEYRLTQRRS